MHNLQFVPPRRRRHNYLLCILTLAAVLALSGCSNENSRLAGQCTSCHTVTLDASHRIACTDCHRGDARAKEKETAHASLLARPAHPSHLASTCGKCHQQEADELPHSLHYTLSNFVNLVRASFGADTPLASLIDIPLQPEPEDITQLADDMLRRRCLRCHLFTPGDDYTATRRGTGCAACHLQYRDGRLIAHNFRLSPADDQCLSCHYGNRVGFDYYGRFEHDFNAEYRTPYTAAEITNRPYGVEYHQLSPDIHRQRGLACIDCHGGDELMKSNNPAHTIECADCHDPARLRKNLPAGVQSDVDGYHLLSHADGKLHPLPLLQHPAHTRTGTVSCQACHAQWSFNDTKTHLLRSDLDEYADWSRLTVQGNAEVEQLLENNLDFSRDELPPTATDTILNEKRHGIWYKGYTMRRWESIPLGRDENGRVSVMRPLLHLSLSWIDEEENVRFDGQDAEAADHGMLPYTPHTTGPAGMFYEERLREFHAIENLNR